MKELNVISELFLQHLLDRFRENAIEEAIEEEIRELHPLKWKKTKKRHCQPKESRK